MEGGRKAAMDLRSAVQGYLREHKPALADMPIMIRAFANVDGLSQVLARSKVIKSPDALWGFVKGFSQSAGLVDFGLLGSGKDRADEKIKGKSKPPPSPRAVSISRRLRPPQRRDV